VNPVLSEDKNSATKFWRNPQSKEHRLDLFWPKTNIFWQLFLCRPDFVFPNSDDTAEILAYFWGRIQYLDLRPLLNWMPPGKPQTILLGEIWAKSFACHFVSGGSTHIPYTPHFFLGDSMQKQQTWLWDAFASKWPPGQKAGDSVRGGISPPCSGSHACHSHTHRTRGSWTHLSSQHPLFNSPFSGASTKANLPEWNSSSPSVHLTPSLPPEPTLSPVYSSEMQFQNFFNNSFCSSHRIWPLLLDPTRCMPKTAF